MKPPITSPLSRRSFLSTSTGALAGSAILSGVPLIGRAADNKTLKVALVGCGGRGSGAASQAISADPNVVLTAMGDVFSDRLEQSYQNLSKMHGDKVKVDPDHRFVGLDAIDKILATDIDVIILTTPPGFRPEHFEKSVNAGKHIFCEKPIATDAVGVRRFLAAAAESKKKGLGVQSGFCWRSHYAERETFKRIESGMIGEVRAAYGTYLGSTPWSKERKPEWTDLEYQLRNWIHMNWLSGDHLVEQAVHTVDKMLWAFGDAAPISCTGQGGRQQRVEDQFGNVFDHFTIVYEFPNAARGIIACRQQQGCASDVSDHILGTKGVVRQTSGRMNVIEAGTERWKFEGEKNDMYQTEHDEFFASIRAGKPFNFAEKLAHTTLVAIMGRMSAYTGQTVTWDQMLNSQENLQPQEALDFKMKLPIAPAPMPGRTKFV
ncbi:MAG: oxidoreductase domain protein [Chthoniobacteraceae bacterium]|nr:oxidoreductase domain protein [Chthoniobacteraceae bacterium]